MKHQKINVKIKCDKNNVNRIWNISNASKRIAEILPITNTLAKLS